LFDPPKRFERGYLRPAKRPQAEPRIRVLDVDPNQRNQIFLVFHQSPPPTLISEKVATVDDGTVSAIHLCRRLFAIKAALEDLPRQAMRLARWRSRRIEERRPERSSPLRFGRPPGFRKRPIHEVDDILKECHWLARNVEPALDTS
jgi:hypothetical protein